MKSYKHFWLFFILSISACKAHYLVNKQEEKLYKINASVSSDTISQIDAYIKPYRDSLSKTMNEVIGEAAGDFTKDKNGGSLGALIVEAMDDYISSHKKNLPSFQGSLTNPGGIRISQITKGPITLGKIFELLPFENEMVVVVVKESILPQWEELINKKGGWPCTSKKIFLPVGAENVDEITGNKLYYLATNDYVANGGDDCTFLKDCKQITTGATLRTILIEYIKTKHIVTPSPL
jgi:2',3'-cyclic-nucleotide 2'-phosphodiesterase (5'-nucleotidase family)